jgi:hypothetical protein
MFSYLIVFIVESQQSNQIAYSVEKKTASCSFECIVASNIFDEWTLVNEFSNVFHHFDVAVEIGRLLSQGDKLSPVAASSSKECYFFCKIYHTDRLIISIGFCYPTLVYSSLVHHVSNSEFTSYKYVFISLNLMTTIPYG